MASTLMFDAFLVVFAETTPFTAEEIAKFFAHLIHLIKTMDVSDECAVDTSGKCANVYPFEWPESFAENLKRSNLYYQTVTKDKDRKDKLNFEEKLIVAFAVPFDEFITFLNVASVAWWIDEWSKSLDNEKGKRRQLNEFDRQKTLSTTSEDSLLLSPHFLSAADEQAIRLQGLFRIGKIRVGILTGFH